MEYCEIEGKIKFKTPHEAYRRGEGMKKKRGSNIRAYKCPHCDGWHLTSQHDRYGKKRKLHRKGR